MAQHAAWSHNPLVYKTWKNAGKNEFEKTGTMETVFAIVKDGILLNILNPKLTLFFLSFLPQFMPEQDVSPLMSLLMHSAIFMLMTFATFIGYGLFASFIGDFMEKSSRFKKHNEKGFAPVLAGIAIKMAAPEK